MSFVILTSKPGIYRTHASEDVQPRETWDYLFHGVVKTRFVIAELMRECKVRVTDEVPPPVTASVPSKFLPRFPTVEAAAAHLQDLARTGIGAVLEKQP